jgi:non-ribosomal peptide synthase protein (TIGR01720 family)
MFLGRLDEEVKIRGHRVAPAAVAAMLRDCSGVRDAAALAETDGRGRVRLLAFVAGPALLSEPEMRRWAAANLPPAMVPDAIVRLDELPRTANGKVDRDRLRTARPAAGASAETNPDAGGALLAIWRDILGVPEAGPDDDFFALGGDSIMAIQIAGRARAIGLRFNAQILFEHPTVNELLAVAAPVAAAVPAPTPPQQGAIPLTPVQRGFFQLRPPKPGHWGLSAILRLPPDTTADAVRRALPRVVGRHRALRLRFTGEGIEARQDLAAAAVLAPLTMLDHRGLDDAARRQAEDKAATELMVGIDLLGGALIGAAFIARAAGESPALLVAVHHLVFDAVSLQIFADDLFAALDPAMEPAETPGFDSWCRLLPAEAERRAGEMSHWQAVEARIAPVLPRLPNPGANSEGNVAREAIRLPVEATAALRQAATAQQAGLQDATLAALLAALARWAPRGINRGIVIDLEGHGREEIDPSLDLSRIVGWFTTHFPVAFDPDPKAAAGAQIAAVREALRAVPGRGLGYGLLRYLRSGSSLGRDPELSFNFLGTIDLGAGPAARFERVSVGVERDPATPRRHLLVVEAYVADGRLSIDLFYAREAISAEVVGAIRDAMTDWFVSSTVAPPVPPSTTLPDHLALTEDDLRALNKTLGLGT